MERSQLSVRIGVMTIVPNFVPTTNPYQLPLIVMRALKALSGAHFGVVHSKSSFSV